MQTCPNHQNHYNSDYAPYVSLKYWNKADIFRICTLPYLSSQSYDHDHHGDVSHDEQI
jgi:hypothetical protein